MFHRIDEVWNDFDLVVHRLGDRSFDPPVRASDPENPAGIARTGELANLGLFLVIYVEFVSLSVAFRPHLQRWWMFLLAGFHVSTLLTMKVYFAPATAMLLVLGIFTPFARFEGWRRRAVHDGPAGAP